MIRAASIAFLLTGCATYSWDKPGSTQAGYNVDSGQCAAQAYSVSDPQGGQRQAVYNSCMEGKGWELRREAKRR